MKKKSKVAKLNRKRSLFNLAKNFQQSHGDGRAGSLIDVTVYVAEKLQLPKPKGKGTAYSWLEQNKDLINKSRGDCKIGNRKMLQPCRQKYNEFYTSPEWRSVRYGIIEKHKGKCCACGQSYKEHGVVMHVDHIKPRSKYPELELDPNNLQLLCEICNLGKMADYQTDWRQPEKQNGNEYPMGRC